MMNFLAKLILKILRKANLNKISQFCKKNIKFGDYCDFKLLICPKSIHLGQNINFRNYSSVLFSKNSELTISENFFMNILCSINCLDAIFIGKTHYLEKI